VQRSKKIIFLLLLPNILFSAISDCESFKMLAKSKNLQDSRIWHSLLHLDKTGSPSINTPRFLLSHGDFSPQKELDKTIEVLLNDKKSVCKYPARFLWLKSELNLPIEFRDSECSGFEEYIQKTSPKDLKLVFVSEQVESPSSMMGHVFFKLEGAVASGEKRENAVSFFTVIDTFNIPYLVVKSTITGMDGYFILSPYKNQIDRYLNLEDRNIWEYELALDDEQKKLIYHHFWELKDIDITYLFTGFNCATIVDDMLAIADENYKDGFYLWVTPKDVIKRAHKKGVIKKAKMTPSIGWELRMLGDSLDSDTIQNIKEILKNRDMEALGSFEFSQDEQKRHLEKNLILAYTNFLDKAGEKFSDAQRLAIADKSKSDKAFEVDLSKYKNPIKSPNSSKISFRKGLGNGGFDELSFLPASNELHDDNRQYFGESSLKIGEISLSKNKSNVKLERLELFSMSSLTPWDSMTNSISKEFFMGIENQYDSKLQKHQVFNTKIGFGLTKKLSDDLFVYSLGSVGIGANRDKQYVYAAPKIGVIIYEIFNMKSVLEYAKIYNQMGSKDSYDSLSLDHSIFVNKSINIGLRYHHRKTRDQNLYDSSLFLSYIF